MLTRPLVRESPFFGVAAGRCAGQLFAGLLLQHGLWRFHRWRTAFSLSVERIAWVHSCQWRPQLWEYVCFRILELTFPKNCKGRRQTPAELYADAYCTVYLWWQKRMWKYCMIMSYYNHRYVDRYVSIRQLQRWCCARSRLTIAPTLMRNSTRSCGHVICWHRKGCETMTELCKGSGYLVGITLLEE